MLSKNFWLIHKAPLTKGERKCLTIVFISIFIDMYDLALFIGYSVYLKPMLIPNISWFQALMVFSIILLITQIIKFLGFLFYNIFIHRFKENIIHAPVIIGFTYLLLALLPSFNQIGYFSVVCFVILRAIQAFALGEEIAFSLYFANLHFANQNKRFMFYFILFAGEIGVLCGIVINRAVFGLLNNNLLTYDFFWRLEFFFSFLCICGNLIWRINRRALYQAPSLFTQRCFFYTISRQGKYFFIRSIIISFHVALLLMIIFRVPQFLDLFFHYRHHNISLILGAITILSFIGANIANGLILLKFKPQNLMFMFYVISIVVNFFYVLNPVNYVVWLCIMGFIYGVFVRATPEVLYKIKDFHFHNRLTGRYLGYILAYMLWGTILVVMVNLSHMYFHSVTDKTAFVLLGLYAILGIISLKYYLNYYLELSAGKLRSNIND